jgi:HPt (histidine-containing phosphotransfer) domain-containing protein
MVELQQSSEIPSEAGVPLRSEFADDHDFADVLAAFVSSLPALGQRLEHSLRRGDVGQLRTQAHQLKGAAGGYGFPELTALAATLEAACEANEAGRMAEALERLLGCLGRIRV